MTIHFACCHSATAFEIHSARVNSQGLYELSWREGALSYALMEANMYSALAGTFFILAIGTLMAFAMDAFSLRSAIGRARFAKINFQLRR